MSAFVIAGTHSGCGKTTITLALLGALKKRGLSIQSFKAGPDFIDGGLHRLITARPSRNLDLWMCGEEYAKKCFYKHSKDVDIAIVEGVMGLYDGDLSNVRLAEILNLPVILVVDAYGMAESAGAIVEGFKVWSLKRGIKLSGIILNRVASERHYERIKKSIRDIEVLGFLPRNLNFEIPHRHLGLTVAEENPITEKNIELLTDAALKHINLEEILKFQKRAKKAIRKAVRQSNAATKKESLSNTLKIAVAYDKAFCFYYEDNLDLLKEAGAEIVKFSPIFDEAIPEANFLYIGGGYPEIHAERLSKNKSMIRSVRKWADEGRPIYAECGGLIYLSKGVYDFEGNFFKMAGIFPFEIQMKKEGPNLGYREIILKTDSLHGKKGDKMRGHEFHYSDIKSPVKHRPALKTCYSLFDNKGKELQREGYNIKNVLASYVHVHFGSNLNIAKNLIHHLRGGGKEI